MDIQLLKENTKTLASLLDMKLSALARFDVIMQLRRNLVELKSSLSTQEFKEFREVNSRVEKIIDQLMKVQLGEKVSGLLNLFKNLAK